ncbi:ESPR-type extended signal peptide-containing protein [Escherichia albertii]|uniref:ESPR-type extended signal peptide-containing protein n=1 Tax=Escherichia albertii TaxID=208962 RepID=UPI001374CCE1|nr:ESPR-type extended signal peptide-containing protein [Escherichia albertii]
MNTIYRVIWNHTLGVYQVCSELTKRMTQSFALTLSGRSELNKKHNRYPQLQQITLIITLGLSSSTLAATTFNGEYTFDENKSYAGYIVGANASGTLNIDTNIVASASDASSSVIGQGTNGRGTVNVYDGGFWDLVDHRYGADSPLSLNIGQEGNGVLNIESGGLVTAGQVILGKLVSSSGEVNVSGNGSILNTRDMLVGQSGTGELLISDYGLVNSSFSSSIGQSRGSSGVVHIENNGQWIIRGTDGQYLDLVVGDSGEGEFYLSTGGKASVGQIQIGKNNTGNGVINVSGVGTELNTYAIQTGLNGVGTLNISDYGVVNSTKSGAVAFAGNSVGIVNVSNHGHWIIKAENGAYQVLNVGVQGYGTVNIESGGVIDADIVTAGFENTGGGLINTANAGSELNIRGLRLGFGSDAILNISDSAVVNNTGQNTFGNNEYVRGTVNITNNGHLNSTITQGITMD